MRFIIVDDNGNFLHINGQVSIQRVEDDWLREMQEDGIDAIDMDEDLPGTTCAEIDVIYANNETDSLELIVIGDVSYLGRRVPGGLVEL